MSHTPGQPPPIRSSSAPLSPNSTFNDLPMAPGGDWRSRAQSQRSHSSPRKAQVSRASSSGVRRVPIWVWGLIVGGGIIAIVIAVTVFSAIGSFVTKRMESQQAVNEIEGEVEAIRREQLASLNSDGPVGDETVHFDRLINSIERRMGSLDGGDAASAKAAVSTLRAMRPEVEAYGRATAALEADGGFDPSIINSTTDIDRLTTCVKDLQSASKALAAKALTLPDLFTTELRAGGASDAQIRTELLAFRAGADLEQMQAMHSDDQAGCAVMLKILDLLKREWNSWEVDPETGEVAFERAAAVTQFNKLTEELMVIAERQMNLQRQRLSQPVGGASGRPGGRRDR